MHRRKSYRAEALRQTCARAFGAAFLCSLIAADCDGEDASEAEGQAGDAENSSGTSGNGGGLTGGSPASGGAAGRGGGSASGGASATTGGTAGATEDGGSAGDASGGADALPEWLTRCDRPNLTGTSCEAPEVAHPYCIQGSNLTTNHCGQREILQGAACDLENAIAVCAKVDSVWVYYGGEDVTNLGTERSQCIGGSLWCARPYADGGLPPSFSTCVRPPNTLSQQINCMCVSDGTNTTNGTCSIPCSADRDCLHPTVEMVCLTECADETLESLTGWCIPPSLNEYLAPRCGAE